MDPPVAYPPPDLHVPSRPIRIVTAASLFDGHDAAINIMRRILQDQGAEVIHLGHNRSVDEVVRAVVCEDVDAVAISSYQGGHIEYFGYLADRLDAEDMGHVRIYGGGGGVIVQREIDQLAARGIRIFSPTDGQRLGLAAMVNTIIADCDVARSFEPTIELDGGARSLARALSAIEADPATKVAASTGAGPVHHRAAPVLGITGTGGSGKSSLTDELIARLRRDQRDAVRVVVLAVDPTRRRGGGALLGDRIRMNAIEADSVFFRSIATRGSVGELPAPVEAMIAAARAWGADLIIVETPGIGQGNSAVTDVADVSLYVMTPEFGAPSQLEKIDMLDLADVVALNKIERRGGLDALRDVRRQVARSHRLFGTDPEALPVIATSASRFNDPGVTRLYLRLRGLLIAAGMEITPGAITVDSVAATVDESSTAIIPATRSRYLAEISDTVRTYHAVTREQVDAVRRTRQSEAVARRVGAVAENRAVSELAERDRADVAPSTWELLDTFGRDRDHVGGDNRPVRRSLSGLDIPRVAMPSTTDDAELVRFLRSENLPGRFPFTAGVFTTKRDDEDPTRMFAGEGGPSRTNRRFHLLAEGQSATRLSTAFDSVTLYGADPDDRPDILGKVGNSGVSVASLDDMKDLFDGVDLCDPSTSVSMTINGPAPAILAMFLNCAIDQRVDDFRRQHGRDPDATESAELRAWVLANVRGTVQADILKEDQGQNTCIFSTEFALSMMADIAEWFVEHEVKRFYSASISGYHIAEAGANPISQLAFTLSNAFTYVEAYLARGMSIDDFAPNLSFFFSNGMDPEYTVLGRVARRIWAIAMAERYGASERSQRLKYHIQTSGRSLHAQEMAFNDIRTTLQALCAVYDNANSLHTNAYDEAVTTPTDESVRRAMAIQLVINREWGPAFCDNPVQGSFLVDELTDMVEEAVLTELDRISERGGVLGAMETGYQRGRIQDESMHYEHAKHDGSLPIVGVNTFLDPGAGDGPAVEPELRRSDDSEKAEQIHRRRAVQERHSDERPAALAALRKVALDGGNTFDALMDAVRVCTLGDITDALFDVGGRYRRNV